MKKFYIRFVASFLGLVGLSSGVALTTLNGCAVFEKHSATVSLVVSQATMRYIESKPASARVATATKIISISAQIETAASGDSITIAQLASLALAAIPSNLPPSDRALAVSIVSIAAQELQNKVGENVLTADQLVSVREVIAAVKFAASTYIPVSP